MSKTRKKKTASPRKTKAAEANAAKAKATKAKTAGAKTAVAKTETVPLAPDDRVLSSNLALHELFAQQTARMLDRADLSEEQKQSILIGMSCPCCGAGGFSFTAKLKR